MRIEFTCKACESAYVIDENAKFAKVCRVCDSIAKEEGVASTDPKFKAAVEKAVAAALAKSSEAAEKKK